MPDIAPQSPALEISCETCGARVVVERGLRTAECPYCASPHVIERPPAEGRPDPTFVLGFTVDRASAEGIVGRWIKSRGPFVHGGLKKDVVERTRGIYLPTYLYSARAQASYRARIGENYTVTVTYTTTDSKGRSVTRTRTETRTEWRDLSGEYEAYVMDILVTASKGIGNEELESVEPFDLRALRRYNPGTVSGWIAEEPTLSPEKCIRMAEAETRDRVVRDLGAFMPGDSHSDLQVRVALNDEEAHLALLPVWVFAVRYSADKPPARILINGQNGKVSGRVPLSLPRILGISLLALLVVALVAMAIAA